MTTAAMIATVVQSAPIVQKRRLIENSHTQKEYVIVKEGKYAVKAMVASKLPTLV